MNLMPKAPDEIIDSADEMIGDLNYQIANAPPNSDTRILQRTIDHTIKLRDECRELLIMTRTE